MNATAGRRVGVAMMVVAVGFLTVDAVMHLANPDVVREVSRKLGLAENTAPLIGIIELCGVAAYVCRRTSLVGAILLTGFLGGAVAVNLRAEQPVLGTVLFPVYVLGVLWASLMIRNDTVRAAIAGPRRAGQTGAPSAVLAKVV